MLESELLEGDYRTIRDRQMETLEKEDGMMTRPAVLNLKEKLYAEAYDVMSDQRWVISGSLQAGRLMK